MLVIENLGDVTLNPLDPIPVATAALGTYDRSGFRLGPELGVMDEDPARMAQKIESRRKRLEGEFKSAFQEGKRLEANLQHVKNLAPADIPGAAAVGPAADIRAVKMSLAPQTLAQDDVGAVEKLIAAKEAECKACRDQIGELTARLERAHRAEGLAKGAAAAAEAKRKADAERLAFEAKKTLVIPVPIPSDSKIKEKLLAKVPVPSGAPPAFIAQVPRQTVVPALPVLVPPQASTAKAEAFAVAKAMITPTAPFPEVPRPAKKPKCVCEPARDLAGWGFSGYTLEGLGESVSETESRCRSAAGGTAALLEKGGQRKYKKCLEDAAVQRIAPKDAPTLTTNPPSAPGAGVGVSAEAQHCEDCKLGNTNPANCPPECPPPTALSFKKGRQATPVEEAANQREVAELQRQEAARASDEAEKQRLLDEATKRDALADKLAGKKSSLTLPIAGGILGLAAIYLASR